MTGDSGDLFARYCFDQEKIRQDRFHHRLFHPRHDKLSVQLIDGLQTEQVEEIGRSIGTERDGSLYGWGKLTQSNFEQEGLTVCIDNDPRLGHTNIRGWPMEPDILLQLRQGLANTANSAGLVYVPCCTAA